MQEGFIVTQKSQKSQNFFYAGGFYCYTERTEITESFMAHRKIL